MDFIAIWHVWIIAGLIAGALEIKLSGFIMLWFAVGAFAAALGAGLGLGVNFQLALFIIVSAALFGASRTIFQKAFMRNVPNMKIGAEAMIGEEAIVIEALPASGAGTVRINGELWHARSVDGAIEPGERVRIDSMDGLKLRVRRNQDAPVVVQRVQEKK
jgi:membrane protein implicated in regulation of membrane protease activity